MNTSRAPSPSSAASRDHHRPRRWPPRKRAPPPRATPSSWARLRAPPHRIGPGAHRRVENVELLGHERHVVVRVGDALLVVRQPTDASAAVVGETVTLVAEPTAVHLFDPRPRSGSIDRPAGDRGARGRRRTDRRPARVAHPLSGPPAHRRAPRLPVPAAGTGRVRPVRVLPARPSGVRLGTPTAPVPQPTPHLSGLRAAQGHADQRPVHLGPHPLGAVHALQRAAGPGARRAAGGRRAPAVAGHQGVPGDLLLHRRLVGGGGECHLLHPGQPAGRLLQGRQLAEPRPAPVRHVLGRPQLGLADLG